MAMPRPFLFTLIRSIYANDPGYQTCSNSIRFCLVRITIVEKSSNNFIIMKFLYSYKESDHSYEDFCDLNQCVRNIEDEIDRIYFLFY